MNDTPGWTLEKVDGWNDLYRLRHTCGYETLCAFVLDEDKTILQKIANRHMDRCEKG